MNSASLHSSLTTAMDPAYMGGMSPSYVPRKRKTAPPQQRSSVPYPVVQRMPERSFEMSVIGLPRNDEAQALEAQKMKRSYGRKRYEDLQNVTPGPVGVGYPIPDPSCCAVMSSSLANGMEGGFAPPLTRMPPRLVAKDCWPSPGLSSSLSLGPGPIPGPIPHLDQGRDRGQDQAWRNDFIMKKMPRVEMERSAPVTSFASEVRLNVPAPVASAYVQNIPGAAGFSQNSLVSGSFSQASPTPSQPSEEPKNKTPISFSTKKEPPVYPPGSQEERWQLQILDKGRVTCPKCKSVSRKTVEGLKKHMESCRLTPFTCQHCGKQLKSSTGMKYHIMADHSNLPSPGDGLALDDQSVKEKLRKVLKRLGRLKCSKEGCSGSFTSIMGYLYHMKKCGKEESELEKLLLNCSHCGKAYKSKAGLEYHLKSEHAPVPQPVEEDEEGLKAQREPNAEWSHSGRVQRQSAQVAVFHLQEIANDELSKDWPKKKFLRDLVPDDRKLKYSRPGLPSFSQEVLRKWKNEVKLQRKVQCPNQGCDCVYTSVSGLKAHLGLCCRGDFEAGKYRCLICNKEFNSESGVKYHINSVHSQDWFVVNKKASIKFEKFLKMKPKHSPDESSNHHHHLHLHHLHHLDLLHHQQHQHLPEMHHHHQQHQHHQQQHHLQQQHLQQQLVEQPHHQQQFLPHHEHHLQYQHPHLHDQNQPLLQQLQPQLHPPQPQPPVLQYTPLESWLERRPEPPHAQREAPGEAEGKRRERGGGGGKFNGGDSHSSSSSGSSSSESETEVPGGQRHHDQWALKRPVVMDAGPEVSKRHRNNN
ncbi:uncharacterized protein znf512 isoform X1 [Hypomesus transpacificus]|uniref:uncharacterized protein znf512 isoform X1 n=2 Tax=Hypomesus transpacificus TaxID=137520 RepID=UPI001F080DF7|nr:uncharacterized protein znf512 isoform X1 [Hypomesus transpacificus]